MSLQNTAVLAFPLFLIELNRESGVGNTDAILINALNPPLDGILKVQNLRAIICYAVNNFETRQVIPISVFEYDFPIPKMGKGYHARILIHVKSPCLYDLPH